MEISENKEIHRRTRNKSLVKFKNKVKFNKFSKELRESKESKNTPSPLKESENP